MSQLSQKDRNLLYQYHLFLGVWNARYGGMNASSFDFMIDVFTGKQELPYLGQNNSVDQKYIESKFVQFLNDRAIQRDDEERKEAEFRNLAIEMANQLSLYMVNIHVDGSTSWVWPHTAIPSARKHSIELIEKLYRYLK